MLRHMQIRDFAIIDALELELGAGMTVLTGETGAGKSILVDALLIAVGGRAGAEVVRHGAERADITATFSIDGNETLRRWFSEQEIELEGECVLRRVVGSDGRSRSFVNGRAMPAQALRELGESLVDVHGQMEHQSLMRRGNQRELLDQHGEHQALTQKVAGAWRELKKLREEFAAANSSLQERASRIEMLKYYLGELDALDLEAGEPGALLSERQRLSQRGRLAEGTGQLGHLLADAEEASAEYILLKALNVARGVSALDAAAEGITRLIDESLIAVREAGVALRHYESTLDSDPARQEWVEQRLAAIEAIARKHRLSPEDLPSQRVSLHEELQRLETIETALADIQQRRQALEAVFRGACEALSKARVKTAAQLGTRVTALMQTLGMAGGRFDIDVRPLPPEAQGEHGGDEIEFLVSANPGQPLKPLAKVASGGELSRISLAVQVAAVESARLPCLVFDEVDAGVGGGIAEIVGRQLRALGERSQVLCVTHLPQVAGQAHAQIRVAKLTDGKTTRTTLHMLTAAERVEEIARMLGGVKITDQARQHAAEMLNQPTAPSTPAAGTGTENGIAGTATKPKKKRQG